MQNMEKLSDPYKEFLFALNSPVSKERYSTRLRWFFTFLQIRGTMEERCQLFVDKAKEESRWAYESVIGFLQYEKDRCERKEITGSTVRGYYKAVKLFMEVNDILIPWNKIKPKEYGPVIKFMREYHDEITSLRELQNLRDSVNEDIYKRRRELSEMDGPQKELQRLNKQIDEKKIELSKIQGEAERLKKADPRITAVQLAEARAREILQDRRQLLMHAVDASLLAIRQDPSKNFLLYPVPWNVHKQLAVIPGGVEKAHKMCIGWVVDVANQLFDRLVNQAGQGASRLIDSGNSINYRSSSTA